MFHAVSASRNPVVSLLATKNRNARGPGLLAGQEAMVHSAKSQRLNLSMRAAFKRRRPSCGSNFFFVDSISFDTR